MSTEADAGKFSCHLCSSNAIEGISGFQELRQVTSDCRPWTGGARLGTCAECGTVQKAADEAWRKDVETIYQGYEMYQQGDGAEQAVFDQKSGRASSRSRMLLENAGPSLALGEKGKMLDIGCGNGALFRAFGALFPGWALSGTERDDRHRAEIESLPGVETVYGPDAARVPGTFDVITMVHVLEHVAGPADLLGELGNKLKPDGRLVIQVPAFRANPFDLTIADHCSHFTAASLCRLLDDAGFEVIHCETGWMPRELTIIAKPQTGPACKSDPSHPDQAREHAEKTVAWLATLAKTARNVAENGPVGIFGSSIAATWLFAELDGNVVFFVDEDENRIGRSHLDLPIRAPADVPADISVILALAPETATAVAGRLEDTRLTFIRPPDVEPAMAASCG